MTEPAPTLTPDDGREAAAPRLPAGRRERQAAELVLAYLAAGDRGDWAALAACLADDVVTHSPGGVRAVGVAAQRAAWESARGGLSHLHHEARSVVVSGNDVAVRVAVTGTHTGSFLGIPPTGATIRVDQALFVRLESGRIAELWEVVDTGAGLRQLGVLGDQPLGPAG